MIEQVGLRKVLILVILAGISAFIFGLDYLVLKPQKVQSEMELAQLQSDTAQLVQQTEVMRNDIALFETQKVLFQIINKMGFFNEQDRVLARERFKIMQRLSMVISAKYQIQSATVEENPDASLAGYIVLNSPISITLSALDDLDIYRFVYLLNYAFPGHITIKEFNIERKIDVNNVMLREIGTGGMPEVISATMMVEWRTMAKKSSDDPSLQPQGAQ